MSSAILYVAIVAIWACVLIPRWLHRGTATPVTEQADYSSERVVPSPQHSPSPDVAEEKPSEPAAPDEHEDDLGERESSEGQRRVSRSREESRRRMLAARRRLLLMLLGLEAAAVSLAVLKLAALWVLIPPTIMLAGYLLLLREVARADAERTQREAQAARSRAMAAARSRASERGWAPPPTAPAPSPEPAPGDYSDLGDGRDFAPGLAGKYTTSNSDVIDFSEYKRAVGD